MTARDRGSSRPRDARDGAVVLGDLLLDVVLAPAGPLEHATDVPGRVVLRQGGSAATTARWLARLGTPTTLVTAVGRDAIGRALVDEIECTMLTVRARWVPKLPTGRIGVLVEPSGERSFVADRGAADGLEAEDVRPRWFRTARLLHLPAYSLLTDPLRQAATRAVQLARDAGAQVSVDLASTGPLLAVGRSVALERLDAVSPDVLFGTQPEAEALLAAAPIEVLLELAPVVVLKRGQQGALILARSLPEQRLEARPTRILPSPDTTGAGDAFDAGFLHLWTRTGPSRGIPAASEARRPNASGLGALLRRAAASGNQAAGRQLRSHAPELPLGRLRTHAAGSVHRK